MATVDETTAIREEEAIFNRHGYPFLEKPISFNHSPYVAISYHIERRIQIGRAVDYLITDVELPRPSWFLYL
jgi:hypothetical protein